MTNKYWIQSNNSGEGWRDEFFFDDQHKAQKYYARVINDAIWLNSGKRQWRLIERTTFETVLFDNVLV